MSDIDFQNGLAIGMTLAGKDGLIGQKPIQDTEYFGVKYIKFIPNSINFNLYLMDLSNIRYIPTPITQLIE